MKNAPSVVIPIPDAAQRVFNCWRANKIPVLIGPPGIGKTAIMALAAKLWGNFLSERDKRPVPVSFKQVSMATATNEDVTVPVREADGSVRHVPVGGFREATERPTVLFLDEKNRCGQSTQNAMLCLEQSRIVGDFAFHPDTRIAGAQNDADEEGGEGASETLPALADREVWIYVKATFAGVFDYLTKCVGEEGSTLRELAVDYAFSADRSRQLVSFEATPGVLKRASPRAIENGLAVYDAEINSPGGNADFAFALLAGAIGEETAGAFLAIRKVRKDLPSADEIEKNPKGAKLPKDVDVALAAMGLLGVVGTRSPDAAWIYLDRLKEYAEVQTAACKALTRTIRPPTGKDAISVRNSLLGRIGLAQAGQAVGLSW